MFDKKAYQKAYQKERAKKNKERIKEYNKKAYIKYRKFNEEWHEKNKKKCKNWLKNNKERAKNNYKIYYEKVKNDENYKKRKYIHKKEWISKNKKHVAEQSLIFYWKHHEKNKEKLRKSYYIHKKKRLQYKKEYDKTMKGKIIKQNIQNKRRAQKRQTNNNSISKKELLKLFELQNYKCIYCGSDIKEKNHLDHIIPISKGGAHSINNVQFLCPKCNMVKGNKLVFRNYG